ncbi:hypothetical protein ES705_16621 [subsurface metagenome]
MGQDACHLKDHFPVNAPDIDWLPFLTENSMALITLDLRITKNPLEVKLLKIYNVKTFFLEGKTLSAWQRVVQVFRAWEEIKNKASKRRPPHIFKVVPKETRVYTPEQL